MQKKFFIISEQEYHAIDAACACAADIDTARNIAKEFCKSFPGNRQYILTLEEYAMCEVGPCTFFTAENLTKKKENGTMDTVEAETENYPGQPFTIPDNIYLNSARPIRPLRTGTGTLGRAGVGLAQAAGYQATAMDTAGDTTGIITTNEQRTNQGYPEF